MIEEREERVIERVFASAAAAAAAVRGLVVIMPSLNPTPAFSPHTQITEPPLR